MQNEAGALARVANLFSSRGYNIESLNVAPTADETVSRLTLVTTGSETVIDQIEKQLGKLVDVVDIVDMTKSDHIERELALFKLHVTNGGAQASVPIIEQFGARVLNERGRSLHGRARRRQPGDRSFPEAHGTGRRHRDGRAQRRDGRHARRRRLQAGLSRVVAALDARRSAP